MKKKHARAITEEQIKSGVVAKIERMKTELKRNPNNMLTAQRLAEFKQMHKSKL